MKFMQTFSNNKKNNDCSGIRGVARALAIIIFIFAIVILLTICVKEIKLRVNIKKYSDTVFKYSDVYNLEPALVFAVICAESSFNPKAISGKGACGLMQIMPETAGYIANIIGYNEKIDLFNYECNICLGCSYLNYLFERFKNEKTVICAYNAGEGNVLSWMNNKDCYLNGELYNIPFPQTRNYYVRVEKYKKFFMQRFNF